MNQNEQPGASQNRWWIHFGLLAIYPLAGGLLSLRLKGSEGKPLLPESVSGLLNLTVVELGLFVLIFALSWFASRASVEQLLLKWRDGYLPLLRGLIYSVALRIAIVVAMFFVIVAVALAGGAPEGLPEKIRPRVEVLVDPDVLVENPLYFALSLTLVSFILAGLREELWRSGMLAACGQLYPKFYERPFGKAIAVIFIALLFGLGHLVQGWSGVAVTTLLGMGLGAILVVHRSIWDAVMAHGFFNATTFVILYWVNLYHPDLLAP